MSIEDQRAEKKQKKTVLGIPYLIILGLASLLISVSIIAFLNKLETVQSIHIVNGTFSLPEKPLWALIAEHIATAFFILGIWHTIDQLLIKKEFNSEIIDTFSNFGDEILAKIEHINAKTLTAFKAIQHDQDEVSLELRGYLRAAKNDALFGLVSTHDNATMLDQTETIRTSKRFIAVMADGEPWVTRHTESLRDRLKNKDLESIFILVHPTSEQIPIVARKKGMKVDSYLQRLDSAITQLKTLARDNHNVRILGHSLISNHCLYVTERHVLLSPYYISNQRWDSPVFEIKDAGSKSYYQRMVADVEALISECADLRSVPLLIENAAS